LCAQGICKKPWRDRGGTKAPDCATFVAFKTGAKVEGAMQRNEKKQKDSYINCNCKKKTEIEINKQQTGVCNNIICWGKSRGGKGEHGRHFRLVAYAVKPKTAERERNEKSKAQ